MLTIFQTDSLKKISTLSEFEILKNCTEELLTASVLKGEHYTYEVLLASDDYDMVDVTVSSSLPVSAYDAKKVPVDFPTYENSTGAFITREPSKLPDLLVPLKDEKNVLSLRKEVATVFLDLFVPEDTELENTEICLTFSKKNEDGTAFSCMSLLNINVLPVTLEKNPIHFTQWFHTDCIARAHHVEIYSEEHWMLIEKYMKMAASLGVNLLLTPALTPALDTAIGQRRPSVQLVTVTLNGPKERSSSYSFSFDQLDRFMDLAEESGINDFEISHLFSQWGLKYAPNIEAYVNGTKEFIFGWDTEADGIEYKAFLQAYLPSLISHLEENRRLEHCFFHLSDEPSKEHLSAYKNAHDLVRPYLKGRPIMDAISDYDFYKEGLIDFPVTASNHLAPFIEAKLENQWTYTCCAQHKEVGNRFISMPGFRNRILGLQMNKYDIKGFLHWGYNFYYTAGSVRDINPYLTTSGEMAFPSGDPFTVYPGAEGPLPSMRGLVFRDALQDMEILKTAEKRLGKEKIIDLLDRKNGAPLTFETYNQSDDYILSVISEVKKLLLGASIKTVK